MYRMLVIIAKSKPTVLGRRPWGNGTRAYQPHHATIPFHVRSTSARGMLKPPDRLERIGQGLPSFRPLFWGLAFHGRPSLCVLPSAG
jgi:hypothetical protein